MRPRYLFFTTLWLVAAVCAFAQSPETVLYSFLGDPVHIGDGRFPAGSILFDHSGNLYGVTAYGGPATALDSFCLTVIGCGTVYKLTHSQAGWSESRLYTFCPTGQSGVSDDCPDGREPLGGLISDNAGNLYGTTVYGGGSSNPGVVFELSPPVGGGSWTETVLWTFGGAPGDGSESDQSLTFDTAGNLMAQLAPAVPPITEQCFN
ncbi:MAG: choice-of-anchor tandem repeat GloVer-containing protein [Terriglobales bacterium]|jgi:uncharacterized repeat protein (TIGR03803 family)